MQRAFWCAILLLVLVPGTAHANVVWPALYLGSRLLTWWAILLGLTAEYVLLRASFGLNPRKALVGDFAMNGASAAVGAILIPLAGFAWELFPGMLLSRYGMNTFDPVTWTASFLLAVLINLLVERAVLRRYLGSSIGRRRTMLLAAVNGITVAAAFISLKLVPLRL